MDVNARNYRWSESRSKVCQMCDMREDETVEHVALECEKYDRDRMEMMRVILTKMGREMNEVIERTGKEWMVLLLGMYGEASVLMIDSVKETVSGKNVVCEIEKLGRVIRVCIYFFLFICMFSIFVTCYIKIKVRSQY